MRQTDGNVCITDLLILRVPKEHSFGPVAVPTTGEGAHPREPIHVLGVPSRGRRVAVDLIAEFCGYDNRKICRACSISGLPLHG